MTAHDLLVLAIAGANGGLMCWVLRRRQQVMSWIRVRARRRQGRLVRNRRVIVTLLNHTSGGTAS